MRWLKLTMQLRNGIGAQRANWAKMRSRQTVVVAYAKRAHVSHRGSRLSHVRRTSCDESVSLSSSHPTRRIVDLGATWSLNLYAGTLGLPINAPRDR